MNGPLTRPRLDEAHVWSAGPLSAGALLSPDEQARYQRFAQRRDAATFAAARTLRRRVLGAYLGIAPLALTFGENAFDKPFVLGALPWDLRFNVSHSGDRVVLAVTNGREVGVDIEQETELDTASFDSVLSASERAQVAALPGELRRAGFFACFTRKEAVIKALGMGMSFPLPAFDVTADPRVPPRLLASRDAALDATRWVLLSLDLPRGFHGALAVAGAVSVTSRDWQD